MSFHRSDSPFRDISRRNFFSSAGKGLGLMALSSSVVGSLFENVKAADRSIDHLSPVEAAMDRYGTRKQIDELAAALSW